MADYYQLFNLQLLGGYNVAHLNALPLSRMLTRILLIGSSPESASLESPSLRLEYLKWVLETLFCSVQFDADPQHVEQLARTDLSLIAPFVNKVILAAPAHSWICTFEIFQGSCSKSSFIRQQVLLRRSKENSRAVLAGLHYLR